MLRSSTPSSRAGLKYVTVVIMQSSGVITAGPGFPSMSKYRRAFDELFDATHRELLRFVSFKVGDTDAADDIAADAYLKFWTRLTQGIEIRNPRALLYTIANGLIIDYYRVVKPLVLPEGLDVSSEAEAPEEVIDNATQYQDLLAQIRSLRSTYRDVLTLHYIEGFEISEIASILSETENNVRVRLHRALSKLKAQVS